MISVHTNLAGMLVRKHLTSSTNKLNQAIERMSTGFKINSAKDNAAGFAIANDLLAKLNSHLIAEENIAMGLDMVTTVTDSLDKIAERVTRLREISMQISNGSYDDNSINTLSLEAETIIKEIERLRSETEYNGVNLFAGEAPQTPEIVTLTVGVTTTSSDSIQVPYEVYIKSSDELGDVVTFDTDKEVQVIDKLGAVVATKTFTDSDTFGNFLQFFRANGMTATLDAGVITLNSDDGHYAEDVSTNGILEQLGIGFVAGPSETVTFGSSTTSADSLTYNEYLNATGDIKFERLGITGDYTVEVKDVYGTQATQDFTGDNSINELLTFLNSNGMSAGINNGIITISSTQGRWAADSVAGGLLEQLGIGQDDTTVTKTVGAGATSSAALTYETLLTADGTATLGAVTGLSGTKNVVIKDAAGDLQATQAFTATSTINELLAFMNGNGMTASISGGVISISSTTGRIVADETATGYVSELGIGVDTQSSTSTVANSVKSSYLTACPVGVETFIQSGSGVNYIRIYVYEYGYRLASDYISVSGNMTYYTLFDYLRTAYADYFGYDVSTVHLGFDADGSISDVWLDGNEPCEYGAFAIEFYSDKTSSSTETIETSTLVVPFSEASTNTQLNIGLNMVSAYMYITVNKEGTTKSISVNPNWKISNVISALNGVGITATMSAGYFSIAASDTAYIVSMSSDLKTALGLDGASFTTTTQVTTYTNSNAGLSHSVTETRTITETDTLGCLGINSNQKITIVQNGTTKTITATSASTMAQIISAVEGAGITASLTDGKMTFAGSENAYIFGMDSALQTALKLDGNYYTTQNVTQGANTPTTQLSVITTRTATTSTSFDTLGLTTDQVINNYKNTVAGQISVTPATTIGDLITQLRQAGLTASFSDGKFSISGSESTYIDSIDSTLETIMKLAAPYYTTKVYTYNSNSDSNSHFTTDYRNIVYNDKFSQLGITGVQNIVVNKRGSEKMVQIDENTTVSEFLNEIRDAGIQGTLSGGKFTLKGGNSIYILSMDTDLKTVLKLDAAIFSEEKEFKKIQNSPNEVTLQVGIRGDENSKLTVDTSLALEGFEEVVYLGINIPNALELIDKLLSHVVKKQTTLGAIANRLESAIKYSQIAQETLSMSLGTFRDADIAEESTAYVTNSIRQQAAQTLMATANQMPSIALGLI